MKRVMLLVLVAVALPTGALASTITYSTGLSFSEQNFLNTNEFFVQAVVVGPTYTISLFSDETTLGNDILFFSGGNLTVANTSTGFPVFVGSGAGGFVEAFPGFVLVDSSDGSFSFTFFGPQTAVASVTVNTIPEPSTLLTFGTGVLGLVGMIRRKLQLGT